MLCADTQNSKIKLQRQQSVMFFSLKIKYKRDTGSYDALAKQPILDAENTLNLFKDVTGVSINGLEMYIKYMVSLNGVICFFVWLYLHFSGLKFRTHSKPNLDYKSKRFSFQFVEKRK